MYMLRVKFNFRLTSFFNLGWFSMSFVSWHTWSIHNVVSERLVPWTTWNIREKVYNDAKSDFAGVAVVI